ncbi:serine/threonine-protein kinase haspin homolog [Prunus avium]|uniref:non-specific serine/threonine protein kinase n=1 Tax=Prunus avium TaxID=42229 RepID=A0A6P5TTR9_PRUAV|nr:serine/threonine-protein kinase haspin homolog [Prunus avium]
MDFNAGGEVSDQRQQCEAIYRRRKPNKPTQDVEPSKQSCSARYVGRVSLAPAAGALNRKTSWTRSLSTRGRTSVAVGVCFDYHPQHKEPKRKGKRKGKAALPKGKYKFEEEKAYFQEVDAFELLEESPSPKPTTWVAGNQTDTVALPKLCSPLDKWLFKKLNFTFEPSSTLSKILQTSTMRPIPSEPIGGNNLKSSSLKTPKNSSKVNSRLPSAQSRFELSLVDGSVLETVPDVGNDGCEDIVASVKKLSLASSSSDSEDLDPFRALLAVCGQSVPLKFRDVFSSYCDLDKITKIGEGTFGEAFKAGNYVCKIVPIDGNILVNGEVQKRSEELLEEVVLSRTLNYLRGHEGDFQNACTMFIETIDLRVCQGSYDTALISAWEDWDEDHGSENDHPKAFPDNQCYVVFVLEHGGKDLESFVLRNTDEARSLLVQVTAALAVAEAAYEFEHRDLHWGNILLSRNDSVTMPFTLEGKQMFIQTFGLGMSIIDFTLSRINTGDDILFLDLSSDPELFKGPKGDKQSETYRKMKEVTEDCWEGSFPRTNALWLMYLVDVLLLKKSFERTSKDERDFRSLKKRLDKYQSAREALLDPSFSDLLVEGGI